MVIAPPRNETMSPWMRKQLYCRFGGLLFPMLCEPAESRYAERNGRARCGVSARGGYHANADRRPPGKLQFHQFDRSFHILPSVMKAAAATIEATLRLRCACHSSKIKEELHPTSGRR